ncbi:beta-d-glucuronidase/beta-L-arabinofuranosidase [Bacteroides sp.]
MRRIGVLLYLVLGSVSLFAQREVSQERMAEIYEEAKTPYKYGLAVVPENNDYKIDCPTVFREGEKWYMTYVVYNGKGAKDGRGYETWIAESDNLLEWHTLGRVLSFRDGTWDCNQRGGFPALPDMEWGGSYTLQSYKGKHWMTYIGGEGFGYEAITAPLYVGLAWTEQDIATAHEWESADKPILSIHDKDAQWWEKLTQYKSTVYWDKDRTLGALFVMFYNAGGRHPETGLKGERVGIALSKDMKRWKRYEGNPVFAHESDGTITGDAHIQKMGDVYVMFYFSAFDPSRKYKAFNTFAASYDLIHWTDWNGADLVIPSKDYDELFAHKSYVVKHDGVVYHFYCAVNHHEQRGIAIATSKPMGRSAVRFPKPENKNRRLVTELSDNWKTWLISSDSIQRPVTVAVPHNWDDYYGYRQLTHGNLHGTAMYVNDFVNSKQNGKRYFLRFEGVGTYATIRLNGCALGRHPVGRTTLTLDVTDALTDGINKLEVKVEHPEMIADMPWVCGGCSSEWGFSEGSQPFGIFRPVILEATDEIRIEPFGIHIWNDDTAATVYVDTEVKNYGKSTETVEVVNKLSNDEGRQVFRLVETVTLAPGETRTIRQSSLVNDPVLWSTENPYLYKLASMIKRDTKTTDEMTTPFGIRTLSWPVKRKGDDGRFYLNGKPVFINGVCEYEHQFGQSHAFSREQVAARAKQIRAAGFNAFRDAHQPHHLDYQTYWDKEGILFWTQFSAHVWYDTPEFRDNFKKLLRQWVKERRNSPSVIMWGLQNESTLPREFAEECAEIIREMDPTARNMRVITTCNGGEGTDWNVIQNWSGTYGGDVNRYGRELSQSNQLLNGEYGAWRSIGLHTEPATFDPKGTWSESRMCRLMEIKISEAERVRDSVCGQFQWIYSSHDNPGRRQPDEGYRLIDKVGPFNYKGLVTPWEEPLDVYYMYKANYVPAAKEPMVYLVSHTWPDRFAAGQRRATIEAYSNCDSVLLYNDAADTSFLGRKMNHGKGTHFVWEKRDIRYNVLRAVGYYGGKPVAEDIIVLEGLEQAPSFEKLYKDVTPVIRGEEGYSYLYRINCGGDAYTDSFGQAWAQDNTCCSQSWAEAFEGLNPYLASQRTTHDPIRGTRDWTLFQSFRFGRHKLNYRFPLPNGIYRLELYFTEPWHGTGGSAATDCEGLRIFDIAVNDSVVIDDLDIWAESGHDGVLKKVVYVPVQAGKMTIRFPEIKAGQALISAIAISRQGSDTTPIIPGTTGISWRAFDREVMEKTPEELLPEDKNMRASVTYEAEDALLKGKYTKKQHRNQTGIFFGKGGQSRIEWNISTGLAQVYALRFKFMNSNKKPVKVRMRFVDDKGAVLKEDMITFPDTPEKWRMMSTTTGTYVNAGHYKVILTGDDMEGLAFDALDVQ